MNLTRHKTIKKQSASKQTLDVQHQNRVQHLRSIQKRIENLQDELHEVETRLEELQTDDQRLSGNEAAEETDPRTQERIDLKDRRLAIMAELKQLYDQPHTDEVSYLTDTASILFHYYDLIENDSAIGNNVKKNDHVSPSTSSILSYFSKASTAELSVAKDTATETPSMSGGGLSRGSLLDEYMALTDANYIKNAAPQGAGTSTDRCGPSMPAVASSDYASSHACSFCKSKGSMVVMTNDGYAFCNRCQTVEYVIVDHDKPSYKDPPKEISYFAYKRINHFNEWLAQIQGRESTDIPEEVYDKILLEIKKQKIDNVAELTTQKLKDILKKLKLNKYYEHCHHIINRINGMPMPHLTPELEERLRSMFRQIQTPFLKYAPPNRKNFLAYSFCIYKMLQLIEKDEYLVYFPLLKSREKLQQQDTIWKLICEDLGWQFIKSL